MFKKVFLGTTAIALVLGLTGCGLSKVATEKNTNNQNKEPEVIKIGVISSLSGDAAAFGQQAQKISDYLLESINKAAAEKNKKIELIYEDGKCTGTDAVAAYQKLTNIDGVKYIIGGLCSSETMGILPLTKSGQNVLTISAMSSNPKINNASPFSFSFSYDDNVNAKMLAEKLSKYSNIAIINEQNDYNMGIKSALLESLKQYPNTKIVADETFPKGATDVRTIIQKVNKTKPEAVFINTNPGVTTESVLKQIAESGYWKQWKLFGGDAFLSESSLRVVNKEVVEGATVINAPKVTSQNFLDLKKKIEDAKGSVNDIGDFYAASTADATKVMSDLAIEFGNNVQEARNALATRTFSGYIGDISFKNSSFPDIKASVFTVKDYKLVPESN